MDKLRVLDCFSGIGGFSLGLERTGGFETVAFCEIDPQSRKVLNKHWPTVEVFEDITSAYFKGMVENYYYDSIDVVCGGFPCQDISTAGKGAGLDGERSSLWWHLKDVIQETRPKYAIIENVSALRSRGLDRVLGSLTTLGYDAEWHCIPASAVGAPHQRDRLWIVAYPSIVQRNGGNDHAGVRVESEEVPEPGDSGGAAAVAYTECGFKELGRNDAGVGRLRELGPLLSRVSPWKVEPGVGRVAHGVPGRVDRLKQLGNSVVPQVVELIGRAILEREYGKEL